MGSKRQRSYHGMVLMESYSGFLVHFAFINGFLLTKDASFYVRIISINLQQPVLKRHIGTSFMKREGWNLKISVELSTMLLRRVHSIENAHGSAVICFDVDMSSFRGWFIGCIYQYSSGMLHWHWRNRMEHYSNPDGYAYINRCLATTKHNMARRLCIYLGMYDMSLFWKQSLFVDG